MSALLPNGKMVRNHYISADDKEGMQKWRTEYKNTDVFSSVVFYEKSDNSSKFVVPLFFDIDAVNDLIVARESALVLSHMLENNAYIPLDMIEIFFSGYKGFHLVVPLAVFEPPSCNDCLALNKRMAEKAEESGIRFIDKGVYTLKRIWRLPNSRNGKSGLFKIPLSYEELRDIDIKGIQRLAKTPRPQNSFVTPILIPEVAKWYNQALKCVERTKENNLLKTDNDGNFKTGWRKPPCIRAIEKATIPEGIRHSLYVHLARYYAWLGMHPDGIIEEIQEIDLRNPVEDPDSILRAVKSGCKYAGFPGCSNRLLRRYCNPSNCFLSQLNSKKGGKTRKIR